VGKQVAAGGFGDIWKGLVRGQHVSVKVMRIFQQDNIEVVVKVRSSTRLWLDQGSTYNILSIQEFGREALIWRQLSHPNLLPFFGLYYWDKRLCLVSSWMENGNVLQFLRKTPASEAEHISLVSLPT
jgi:serine/threonine protein kinase